MKYAFLLMGSYDSQRDRTSMVNGSVRMVGVSDIEDACAVAKELYREGIDCIELCGAFEEAGARRVIEATDHKIPVGFVVHLPEQDGLFTELFG